MAHAKVHKPLAWGANVAYSSALVAAAAGIQGLAALVLGIANPEKAAQAAEPVRTFTGLQPGFISKYIS